MYLKQPQDLTDSRKYSRFQELNQTEIQEDDRYIFKSRLDVEDSM